MENIELNKAYNITYKWYEDKPTDEIWLIINIKEDEITYKTTGSDSYNWTQTRKLENIIQVSEINIIDFSETLVNKTEKNIKDLEESLDDKKERLRKIEKYIENRSFLWKFKTLLWCNPSFNNNNW